MRYFTNEPEVTAIISQRSFIFDLTSFFGHSGLIHGWKSFRALKSTDHSIPHFPKLIYEVLLILLQKYQQ